MLLDRAPVFWLTARQFIEGRSVRVVALLAAVPILLGGIDLIAAGSGVDVRTLLGNAVNELSIPTLFPLIALILASTAIGNEISDRTLPYITLKPWSRMRLVQEKFLATVLIGSIVSIAFSAVAWGLLAIVGGDLDLRLLLAIAVACLLAIAGYAAVFSLLSLMINRVLMAGLLYVLIWEDLLARFIPGLRLLSIRHYVQSVYTGILDDTQITVAQQSGMGSSLIVLAVVVAVCLLLSWRRLEHMDLD